MSSSLLPCPDHGIHAWLAGAACTLFREGMSAAEVQRELHTHTRTTRRPVGDIEIQEAVEFAAGEVRPGQRARPQPRPVNKPAAATHPPPVPPLGLNDLWERSPVRLEGEVTEAVIDSLFPGNPLLCVGKGSSMFATRHRETWRGCLAQMELIVPSPMSARSGMTKKGKPSEHTLSNTGPRRFLVIEFDQGGVDEQAAKLWYLATTAAPMAVAVHSGGKSLHGWFFCAGQHEERLRRFMARAIHLGADRATWTRSQFVRLPSGVRGNGARQEVYYFAPGVIR